MPLLQCEIVCKVSPKFSIDVDDLIENIKFSAILPIWFSKYKNRLF